MYLAENEDPIPPNSTTFIPQFSISFRVALKRKGVKAKIARILGRVCDRKIQARVLAELSFPSLLFSFLTLFLCSLIFNLNIVV